MDNIIEQIMHFLQFDVASIFGGPNTSCLCCLQNTDSSMDSAMDKYIDNVYQPRPAFSCGGDDYCAICCSAAGAHVDGCEANEQSCDCEESPDVPIKAADNDDDDDHCECMPNTSNGDDICKQIAMQLTEKCSSATMLKLQCIEERATQLWGTLNAHMRATAAKLPAWSDLKAWQKLPFYWAALSNDILCDDPFENFKRFSTGNKKPKKRYANRQHERLLITWHDMNSKQRLPFVMEAFISKVGAGQVNICDEHEIQRIITELQNK